MKVKLSKGKTQRDWADAHGVLVIQGHDQAISFASNFQRFLMQCGAMCRDMHDTNGT